jgi:hypothetical protein
MTFARRSCSSYDAAVDTLVTTAFVDTAGAYVLQALPTGAYDVEGFVPAQCFSSALASSSNSSFWRAVRLRGTVTTT